jgi:small subunit ribosomal protein S5
LSSGKNLNGSCFDPYINPILSLSKVGKGSFLTLVCFLGNGKGTFGYTLSGGKYGKNAASIRAAVNKAGLRLLTIPRHENRTVYHDFFTQYGRSRIIVRQAGGR